MGALIFNFAANLKKMGAFGPKLCIFWRKFSDKRRYSDNFPTSKNLGEWGIVAPAPTLPPFATTSLISRIHRVCLWLVAVISGLPYGFYARQQELL